MSTAKEILAIAQNFIQTSGYNSFSYKDISEKLGIKTSSIHYHFPKKADLGCAVIRQYTESYDSFRQSVNESTCDPLERFEQYLQPYLETDKTQTKICLCAALSGEFISLPESMQHEVINFFNFHEDWLTELVDQLKQANLIQTEDSSNVIAQYISSTLQGALLIARSKKESVYFKNIVRMLKHNLSLNTVLS
ncbi:TetR/AcrR family transcriptional regulator [Aliikangiella maris]|uniref:TetR/AcrR family transcriptional regulator n=2 Tax=Aliikangiella maris TaxID=3162458 RepID=A0ABV2BY57_9GAMM